MLDYPLRAIANNAGVDGAVVVNRVRHMKGKNDGYNADTNTYGDLVKDGVIDPAKVVRSALQNAASVAQLLLTTSSLITEIPVEEEAGRGRSSRPRHGWRHGRHGPDGRHGWHGRHGRHDVSRCLAGLVESVMLKINEIN